MLDLFSYGFMIRALISGIIITLCGSLLGVSLVLNRNSMIGDGLSHVAFGSLAIALALNRQPLFFSLVVAVIAAFFILRISRSSIVSGDALVGIIATSSLAIGVIVISLTGVKADIHSYMFGSILAVGTEDMILSLILGGIILLGFLLLYNRIFALTFDETFARAIGVSTSVYNSILAVFTAVTVVIGMRLMGALLISGLIIFPTVSSMQLFLSFRRVTIASAVIGVFCFVIGLILSASLDTPTGASVIVVNLLFLLAAVALRKLGEIISVKST